MKLGLVYDTETTGLPDWHNPSENENQPHIVQLAAKLIDLDTRETKGVLDVIIEPDGWDIPDEVSKIHGITTKMAWQVGVSEALAVELFLQMWCTAVDTATTRIGHNENFDARLIRIATKRYPSLESFIDPWHGVAKDLKFCTMWGSYNILKLPQTAAMKRAGGRYKYKQPKLSEAYEYFTEKPLEGAHNAMNDVNATIEVYWAIQDLVDVKGFPKKGPVSKR